MLVMEVDPEEWPLGYDAVDGGSTASVAAIIDGIDGADATLADTLYRLLVLFWGEGPHSAFRLGPRGSRAR